MRLSSVALVQGVAPILFCPNPLPEMSFATSNLASYPTPQASTSTMYSWNCYTVMGRFNRSELILNRLLCIIVASSPGVVCSFNEPEWIKTFPRWILNQKELICCSMNPITRAKSNDHSTVTVSWPETLNACGAVVRHCGPSGITMLPL